MKFERITDLIYNKPWAILPQRHAAITRLLEAHLAGAPFPTFPDPDNSPAYEIIGNTAVLPIEGVILAKASGLETMCGAFSLDAFRSDLKELAANTNIENIVLNFDSGGGTVGGVIEAASDIAALAKQKDIYAYVGAGCICASAAYWLAASAKTILASPSAELGSIGVYCAILTMADALKQDGIKPEIFQAGKYKTLGISAKDMTDAERAIIQESVDKSYAQFTGWIKAQRPNVPATAFEGLVYESGECKPLNLIDGTLSDLDFLIQFLTKG